MQEIIFYKDHRNTVGATFKPGIPTGNKGLLVTNSAGTYKSLMRTVLDYTRDNEYRVIYKEMPKKLENKINRALTRQKFFKDISNLFNL